MNKKIFTINSLSGVGQIAVNAILTFISLPVLIKFLGIEKYAVFALVSVIGNLGVFTNLGLNTSLIGFLSKQGKHIESNYDIVVTITLISLISILFIIPAFVFNDFLLFNVLGVPFNDIQESKTLFGFLILANFLLLLGQTFTAILDSLSKVYLTSLFQITYSLTYWILILFAVISGYPLGAVGISAFIAAFLWLMLVTIAALKVWGGLELGGLRNNLNRIIRKQLNQGIKIYASGLLSFCYEPLTKILISTFIGINEVGYFDIAIKIKSQIYGVITKIVYPVFPLIAKTNNSDRLKELIQSFQQKILLLIMPIIISVVFCAKPFVILWLPGDGVELISIGVIFITTTFLLNITILPAYYYYLAKDRALNVVLIQLVNVSTNILIIGISYKYIGFYSALLGVSLSILFGMALSYYFQNKYLSSFILDSWSKGLKIGIICLSLAGCSYLLTKAINSNWLVIIIIPVINFSLSLGFYLTFGLLHIKFNKSFVKGLFLWCTSLRYKKIG